MYETNKLKTLMFWNTEQLLLIYDHILFCFSKVRLS